jgi:protein gp37
LRRGTAIIFAIDMGDIFGLLMPADWIWDLMGFVEECPQVFQILTKFPGSLFHWAGSHGLPENVWAGVTECSQSMVAPAGDCLSGIDAAVKYVCVEPLQERIVIDLTGVDIRMTKNGHLTCSTGESEIQVKIENPVFELKERVSPDTIDKGVEWLTIKAFFGLHKREVGQISHRSVESENEKRRSC